MEGTAKHLESIEHLHLTLEIFIKTIIVLLELAAVTCVLLGILLQCQQSTNMSWTGFKSAARLILAISAFAHTAILFWIIFPYAHDSKETNIIELVTAVAAIELTLFCVAGVFVAGAVSFGLLHDHVCNVHHQWTVRWVLETACSDAVIYVGTLTVGFIGVPTCLATVSFCLYIIFTADREDA
ncbi:hypothetical protein LTR65_008402 [Meristemomyces frigidus]